MNSHRVAVPPELVFLEVALQMDKYPAVCLLVMISLVMICLVSG